LDVIEPPAVGSFEYRHWKTAVRHTILAAREVLLGHPWTPSVIKSRTTMSPTCMRYYDSLMRLLRDGGLSVSLVQHAMHALADAPWGSPRGLFAPDNHQDPAKIWRPTFD